MLQRACIRAGVRIRHSQGFNPHPKMSLPLPRSVGVEADEELLCLQLDDSATPFNAEQLKASLSAQLPKGIELLSVVTSEKKISQQANSATYILPIKQDMANTVTKNRIDTLLANKELNIQRRTDEAGHTRVVDVRPFLGDINMDSQAISVECKISPGGSIRVDEILKLLELNIEELTAPIKRTNVRWQDN